jgi:hypothetical protein
VRRVRAQQPAAPRAAPDLRTPTAGRQPFSCTSSSDSGALMASASSGVAASSLEGRLQRGAACSRSRHVGWRHKWRWRSGQQRGARAAAAPYTSVAADAADTPAATLNRQGRSAPALAPQRQHRRAARRQATGARVEAAATWRRGRARAQCGPAHEVQRAAAASSEGTTVPPRGLGPPPPARRVAQPVAMFTITEIILMAASTWKEGRGGGGRRRVGGVTVVG